MASSLKKKIRELKEKYPSSSEELITNLAQNIILKENSFSELNSTDSFVDKKLSAKVSSDADKQIALLIKQAQEENPKPKAEVETKLSILTKAVEQILNQDD